MKRKEVMKIQIKSVKIENIEDLLQLCIPPERKDDLLFIEGMNAKREWARRMLEKGELFAKIAYIDGRPVGLIQYTMKPDEKVMEIVCIFVPNEKDTRKGIGKALLNSLLEDAVSLFQRSGGDIPRALITWAFEVPSRYPQNLFYERMGFKRIYEDNPYFLYYPIEEGFVYRPRMVGYTPQEEDKGRALIFYDPSCPFCIYFSEKIKEMVKEVAPDIEIRMINQFEESEEVQKRGEVPFCVVNGVPIYSSFGDRKRFQEDVKKALG